jgi:hypothetical protein
MRSGWIEAGVGSVLLKYAHAQTHNATPSLPPPTYTHQDCPAGARLIELPKGCLLTYDPAEADPKLLALIQQVN